MIKWKYKYGQTPNGQRNVPLNLDGTAHDCRRPEGSTLESVEPPRALTGATVSKNLIVYPALFADAYNDLLKTVGNAMDAFYKRVTDAK